VRLFPLSVVDGLHILRLPAVVLLRGLGRQVGRENLVEGHGTGVVAQLTSDSLLVARLAARHVLLERVRRNKSLVVKSSETALGLGSFLLQIDLLALFLLHFAVGMDPHVANLVSFHPRDSVGLILHQAGFASWNLETMQVILHEVGLVLVSLHGQQVFAVYNWTVSEFFLVIIIVSKCYVVCSNIDWHVDSVLFSEGGAHLTIRQGAAGDFVVIGEAGHAVAVGVPGVGVHDSRLSAANGSILIVILHLSYRFRNYSHGS